jgi:hypothetical protein
MAFMPNTCVTVYSTSTTQPTSSTACTNHQQQQHHHHQQQHQQQQQSDRASGLNRQFHQGGVGMPAQQKVHVPHSCSTVASAA